MHVLACAVDDTAPLAPCHRAMRPIAFSGPMPNRWPRAVLFDFDGVIVNSEPLHFLAFHEILAAEKIELSEREYYQDMIGFDDRGAFQHIFAARGRELDPRTLLRV